MFQRLYTRKFFSDTPFYDRDVYENILRDPKSPLGKKMNNFIQLCVLLAVGVIVFETVGDYGDIYALEFLIIDAFVSLVFAGEYIYRFLRARKKDVFIMKPMNIIDFLSFGPFFIGLLFSPLAGFDILKILRIFRTLRLFEVSSHSPIALGFMRTIHQYKQEYKAIFSIFLSILVIVASFVYYVENPINPDFSSIPQALWWAVVTMSTVGYGDMAPITLTGRMLGTILILLGPVLLAVISSITILVFMDVAEAQKNTDSKICRTCKTRNQISANFCFNCGEQHFTDVPPLEEKRRKIPLLDKLFANK